jgi:hypothetical protein
MLLDVRVGHEDNDENDCNPDGHTQESFGKGWPLPRRLPQRLPARVTDVWLGHGHWLASSRLGVRRTPQISCEAVPASILAARARGGTSIRTVVGDQPGAAESFVSFIRLFDGTR